MAFASYVDLQASVQAWLARSDALVINRIPDFIRLGEERIGRKLRVSGMVQITTLTIVAGQNWVALPTDWLAFERIDSATRSRIEYMSPDALADLPKSGDDSKYSIEGGRLLYGVTPIADTVLNVRYYQRPPFLASASSTWLLTASPSLYLYAALAEASLFLKSPDEASRWGQMFEKTLAEMKGADEGAMISGSRLRMRPR
ncbi:phage adaptor protein [Variovorax sp. PBL-E5]|uniref:phage adaptor protein n=1 Tax=Variovorax sp. PBL-E5 TaxID=434014 RepID=UPI0013180713|nr:hypothetical protein [Variovorax sp. PBL-E5]VTU37026.1 hypothetical protein E5CHR_04465 [Variovorax sp. PBL-E5]